MASNNKKETPSSTRLPLTALNAQTWKTTLLRLLDESDIAQIDLHGVNDCDTAGMQLLLSADKAAREKNKRLVLKNPGMPVHEAAFRLGIDLAVTFEITE